MQKTRVSRRLRLRQASLIQWNALYAGATPSSWVALVHESTLPAATAVTGALVADYYTHISTMIKDLTPQEKEWWSKTIWKIAAYKGLETGGDFYQGMSAEAVPLLQAVENAGYIDWGIQTEIGEYIWFHDEDGAPNLFGLANLIQIFLKQFRPDSIHTFRWAETCSKPRLDAYGGGLMAITAKDMEAVHISALEQFAIDEFKQTGVLWLFPSE